MKIVFPLLVLVMTVVGKKYYEDVAAQQIIKFAERTKRPSNLTTANGSPVEDLDATVSINRPILFNEYLMETLTHVARQRIPERVVHAKAAGAFGYFEVTHDISDICKANFLNQVNKRTPIAVRFSQIVSDLGSADTVRIGRGFAVKFYTEEGNFDLVGLSIPVFSIKDPVLFPALLNALARNPATNLIDPNMMWDFVTLRPESIYLFYVLPRNLDYLCTKIHLNQFSSLSVKRYLPGYGIHTFQVTNETGHSSFVRFTFTSGQGYKYLTSAEAASISGNNPDYAIKDLYNAIGNGDYPSWILYVQHLTSKDVAEADFDVFDVTRTIPVNKYPLRPVGRFVLNKNPENYFAEVEQLAMCPCNLVPGILGAPDKMFEARRLSYRDAQYYRLGANFHNIPVNCPYRSSTYNVGGVFNTKSSDAPTYYPNSYNGPKPYVDEKRAKVIELVQEDSSNFDQAAKHYEELSEDEKARLIENIVDSLGKAEKKLQDRALKWFGVIHANLSQRVRDGSAAL